MNQRTFIALCALAAFSVLARQPMAPIEIRFLTPETISEDELAAHRKVAVSAFFTQNKCRHTARPESVYADYFDKCIRAFREQQHGEIFFSAVQDNTVVGGRLAAQLDTPDDLLGLAQGQVAYQGVWLYVAPEKQHQGIATALIEAFIKCAGDVPLFLYVYAEHTKARQLYEKFGFRLITDSEHPDGRGTAYVVRVLRDCPSYNPNDFVGYRKN